MRYAIVRRLVVGMGLCVIAFGGLAWGAELQATKISTPKMVLDFDGGWLTRWQNLETGENIQFGKPELAPTKEDRIYLPGAWWVDWKQPANPESAKVSMQVTQLDAETASVQLSASQPDGEIHAVQWGLQAPYDQLKGIHWPRGLAPARISGAGYPESMVTKTYQFNGRMAMLVGSSSIRHQYYVVQGKTGGLLIYMENADLQHHMALEFKKPDDKTLIIANRSILPPPWKPSYTGGRWVIRQYTGQVNAAAQIYQDYLAKAYDIVPLEKRPTRWAKDVAFVQVNDFLRGPLPAPGFRQPNQDYLSGEAWQKSMEYHSRWLEEMAKVVEPSKVMFYITDWRMDGMDLMFPNADVDPYYAMVIGKARKMGFHVMLHCHNHLIHESTTFWRRYIEYPATLKGQDPKKGLIEGIAVDALRNADLSGHNKEYGTSWDSRKGLNRVMTGHHMNPAHGGFRYLMVANLLSAVRATGADAIHLDVPNIWVDLRGELYGMNQMQGQREFYKLLRQTLDENGFEHVAIATEMTPFEGFMKYVDFAQNSRDASARKRAEAIEEGSALAGEELLALQSGKALDDLLKQRQQEQAKANSKKQREFQPEVAKTMLSRAADLGEASLDNMVVGPFIQSYPHLGAYPGSGAIAQRLAIWYGLTHDVMPHTSGSIKFEEAEFPKLEYGKLALSRFWAKERVGLVKPSEWQPGDIARYQLKDGRVLRITRSDVTTMRLAFDKGPVLAELDLLEGWKNANVLLDTYGPPSLKDRVK